MGAAILLESLPREPRFRAVVAESPFSTFEDIAYDRISQASGASRIICRITFPPVVTSALAYARWRYAIDLRLASPAAAVRATRVPVLLIHGSVDTNVPAYHLQVLQRMNPAGIRLWSVPGAPHTAALSTRPEEFARVVLEWFSSH